MCQLALRAAHGLVVDLVALGQQLADLLRVDTADVIVGHEMYLLARFESVRLPATLLILERFGLCRRPSSGGGVSPALHDGQLELATVGQGDDQPAVAGHEACLGKGLYLSLIHI